MIDNEETSFVSDETIQQVIEPSYLSINEISHNETQATENLSQFWSLSPTTCLGLASPCALRVTGHINGQPVTVLVDCGSTHNIL